MSILAVQLNHPGAEKAFKPGMGFSIFQEKDIREWNNDPRHYRKFIQQKGQYISQPGENPLTDELLFWGEWEGNSWYKPLNSWSPNGIHQPFHSLHIRGHQNTDPYVFGKNFHYAVCKQRGQLTRLDPGSLILFGSSFKHGFALDTVFVVGSYETAHEVAAGNANNYSLTYRQATLEQLGETYTHPHPESKLRLYNGQTYFHNADYFSYSPCRPINPMNLLGFDRILFPYQERPLFSSNPTGIKIIAQGKEHVKTIWDTVTQKIIENNYYFGISFQEPQNL